MQYIHYRLIHPLARSLLICYLVPNSIHKMIRFGQEVGAKWTERGIQSNKEQMIAKHALVWTTAIVGKDENGSEIRIRATDILPL